MLPTAFLETIIRGLAVYPTTASISCVEDQRGMLCRIRVSKPDMPRIIGKEGRNINALRLIMNVYAKDGPKISLIVEEPN